MNAIENTIFKEWKYEGCIEGMDSEKIFIVIDGVEYIIQIKEEH